MSKIRQHVYSFGKFLSIIGTLCLLFIMMYIVCSVASRFFTGRPLLGTFELGSTFLPLIAAFFYVNTEIHDRHIRASIIYDRFAPKVRNVLDGVYSVLTAAIFIMVSWRVALFGVRNHQMMAETSVLALPSAPFLFVYSFLLLNFGVFMLFKAVEYFGRKPAKAIEMSEELHPF